MNLSIFTPSRIFCSVDSVQSVKIPSSDGFLGILKDHCPLITSFDSGNLSYKCQNENAEIRISNGFVKIKNNSILILCRSAESIQ